MEFRGLKGNKPINRMVSCQEPQNKFIMKSKPIFNGLMLVLATAGIFFKTMHWVGASIMLMLAFAGLFVSLFTALSPENKSLGMSPAENASMLITFSLLILGTAFRMQHWPGASVLMVFASAATLAMVVYAVYRQNRLKLGTQGTFTLLLFLVILGGLLPNNAWALVLNAG
jgi:quinol-cytochrome oxidoreductase complex cytochrome b subunit